MLPKEFISPFPGLEEALAEEPAVSVRINRGKGICLPTDATAVPWCASGFWLDARPAFTWDPAMHQGLYYVQDASSMVIDMAVRKAVGLLAPQSDLLLLDACAAPGGKTTAAIDALPQGSMVVANEYMPARAIVLAENVAKWGSAAVMVTRGDTSRFRKLHNKFDIIISDVPCSGEGMFRKDAEALRQWSPALVEECAARQREIVANLWEALRPGGILIYSTCTYNRAENEDMLTHILSECPDARHIPIETPENWGTITTDGCLHFVPGHVRGEGQTIFMVSKGEPDPTSMHDHGRQRTTTKERKGKSKGTSASATAVPEECRKWINDAEKYRFTCNGTKVTIHPDSWDATIKELKNTLDIVCAGTEIATIKGRDYIPAQALALSTDIRKEAFPTVGLTYPEAVAYLRREAITLPPDTPRGFILLTYCGNPLGFVKNLGNRANNLYPTEWRILSSHIPDTPPSII